jgi:hypothetical protein
MGRPPQYTPEQIMTALREAHGFRYLAARRLGCDPETIYRYMKRYPHVQAVADAERGLVVDLAESKLYEAMVEGEAWAIRTILLTLGKDRGYVERHEKTGKDGRPLHQNAVIHVEGLGVRPNSIQDHASKKVAMADEPFLETVARLAAKQ